MRPPQPISQISTLMPLRRFKRRDRAGSGELVGIGHFAVGLALKKAEPRLNLGPIIFGAYLCDFLLGIFVWLGLEQYRIPPDFAMKRYMTFTFPYSHGLAATILWSALAAVLVYQMYSGI